MLIAGLVLAACAGERRASPPDTAGPAGSTTAPVTNPPSVTPDAAQVRPSGRPGIPGPFGEAVMVVTAPDGSTLEWCLLLARTEAAREQGLMYTTDETLGGYEGMVFRFDREQNGGFWMRNTRLPLSIAFVGSEGEVAKILDMAPCPDSAATCPTYAPGAPYRDAVEVPEGGFTRLGVTTDATVTFREGSCPPV